MSEAAFEKAVAEGFKKAMDESLKPGSEVDIEQKADQAAEAVRSGGQPPTVAPQEISSEEIAEQEQDDDLVDGDLLAEPELLASEDEDGTAWDDDWAEVEDVVNEPVLLEEPPLTEYEPDESPQDDTMQLRQQLEAERSARLAAETKALQLERQTNLDLQSKRAHWVKLDAPHHPLAQPFAEQLAQQASSRREYVRLLKAKQAEMRPHFEQFLKEERASIEEEKKRLRQEAKEAWGVPVSGPGAPQQAIEKQELRERIERAGSLKERIRLRMEAGDI